MFLFVPPFSCWIIPRERNKFAVITEDTGYHIFMGTAAMGQWSSSLTAFETKLYDVDSHLSVVVVVWAAWDPVCHEIETAMRQAQSSYSSLRFFGLDLDDPQNWKTAQTWGILDTRTLVCLVKGGFHELITTQSLDAQTKAKLSAWNQFAEKQEDTQ